MKRIPEEGFQGDEALREAAAGDFHAVMRLVRAAVVAAVYPGQQDRYISLESIYPDRVVITRDGRLWSYPYSINDANQVELGQAEEVVTDHKPVTVRESLDTSPGVGDEDDEQPIAAIIEAVKTAGEEIGLKYVVRIIRAGVSGNRNYYPDAVLREAAPLFSGVRVFAKSDDEHVKGKGKDFNKLIGRISEAKFVPGKSADTGEIQGTLELLKSAAPVPQKIYEAYQRDMHKDLFGFSIDANAKIKRRTIGGLPVREAQKFTKVHSLDLIIEAGAGGEIINLIEATNHEEQADMKLRDRMIEAIKKANNNQLPPGLDVDDDEALEAAFREAVAGTTSDTTGGTQQPAGVTQEQLNDTVRMVEARANMRVTVAESGLPEQTRNRLLKQFSERDKFTDEQVTEAINDEKAYLSALTNDGHVSGLGEGSFIESGEAFPEKVDKMLDAFFDNGNREVVSIKECYIEITGDKRVTGRIENCDRSRLREAAGRLFESIDSTTFANVLGSSITRRMIADYRLGSNYDVWRHLSGTPVPLNDFRTNERTRMGGYGDLPIVEQSAPYTALTSPGDEKATYAPAKRGGTEDVTIETIKNDDVGVIMRIPTKLSRSAKRTLSKFVLDFLKDNPTIYDSDTLFHANHGNLGSAALDAPAVSAGRLAILKQTELSSSDRIGIPPVNLWTPFDQEETAFDLFRRQTNNDTDFVESLQMNVLPVWYWTDVNDWCLTTDPNEVPIIEIGFLDGNEEPEIFVQDNPTVGSLFTHDKITYKIRHIYGGNVVDYRGAYKSVVA